MVYPPATYETAELKVRPSAWWYLLVVVAWLASIGVGVSMVVTFVRIVDDGVTRIPASGVIAVPADGLTVYAPYRPSIRDCTLTGQGGQQIQMDDISYDLNVTADGTNVYAVSSTPDGVTPGLYQVSCRGFESPSLLWTGDRVPIWSLVLRLIIGTGLFLVGLAALIVLLIRRSLSKGRVRRARLAMSTGYPPGGPGPGWQAPAAPQYPYGGQPPGAPYGQGSQPPYPPQQPTYPPQQSTQPPVQPEWPSREDPPTQQYPAQQPPEEGEDPNR